MIQEQPEQPRQSEQPSSRAAEQPSSRAAEQPSSRAAEHVRAAEQPSSRAAEQPSSRAAEQPSSEQLSSRAAEQPSSRAAEQLRAAEQPSSRAAEQPSSRAAEQLYEAKMIRSLCTRQRCRCELPGRRRQGGRFSRQPITGGEGGFGSFTSSDATDAIGWKRAEVHLRTANLPKPAARLLAALRDRNADLIVPGGLPPLVHRLAPPGFRRVGRCGDREGLPSLDRVCRAEPRRSFSRTNPKWAFARKQPGMLSTARSELSSRRPDRSEIERGPRSKHRLVCRRVPDTLLRSFTSFEQYGDFVDPAPPLANRGRGDLRLRRSCCPVQLPAG